MIWLIRRQIIEDAFVKGFLSYHAFKEELVCLNEQYPDSGFDGVLKLKELYQRGQEKGVQNPEAYAIKNWIIRAQGFLIDCATKGFMDHYEEIMAGTFQRRSLSRYLWRKTDGMSRQYRIPVCILFQRNLPDGSQRSSDPGLFDGSYDPGCVVL